MQLSVCLTGGRYHEYHKLKYRGRLNFLVDLLQFPARQLFWKVKGNSELPPGALGIGDVLSHIGRIFLEISSPSRTIC
jgi:2-oxoglutarate dehydrogenase complex dehydrogenase (E1) component-like enzyme